MGSCSLGAEDWICSGRRGLGRLGGLGKGLGVGMIDALCSGLGAGVLGERDGVMRSGEKHDHGSFIQKPRLSHSWHCGIILPDYI